LSTASIHSQFDQHNRWIRLSRDTAILHAQTCPADERRVALDGKALRHSFDHFQDRKAAHSRRQTASETVEPRKAPT
jgi:hypothetical protein